MSPRDTAAAAPPSSGNFAAFVALLSLLLAAAVVAVAALFTLFRAAIAHAVAHETLLTLALGAAALAFLCIIIGMAMAISAVAGGKRAARPAVMGLGAIALVAHAIAFILLISLLLWVRLAPAPPVDHSLTDAQLLAAGVPSPDHRWTAADYDAALIALRKIAAADPQSLPRWNGRHSGAAFDRITSTDNITSADTVEARIGVESDLDEALDGVRAIYADAATPEYPYTDELIEIAHLMLRLNVSLKNDLQAFVDKLPPDAPRRQDILFRVQSSFSEFRNFVDDWVDRICDGHLDIPQVTRLARYGRDGLPDLLKIVPPDHAREIIARLANAAAAALDSNEKAALAGLVSALRAAAP